MDVLAHLQSALAERYRVIREIGQGGMATVYLARDLRHDRPVALKVLRPELGAVLGVERFLSEIRVTANLQHPNLLPLFDSGAVPARHPESEPRAERGDGEGASLLFYVMPYVEGESLRQRLTRETQLPVDEAVRITAAIGSALDYAHRHGVVHRDLKPENILLHEGQPLVADFGIALAVSNAGGARVTQTGLSLGTPQYMSPEQATGDRQIDARSDIYSLGALMYEMLVGEPPHTGPTIQAIIARVLTDTPRSVRAARPAVPVHVEAAIAKALEKVPADRWATAAQFVDSIRAPLGSGGATSDATRADQTSLQRVAAARPLWRTALPWVAGVAIGAAIGAGAFALRPVTAPQAIRFSLPIKASPACVEVSPDGSRVVYDGGTTTSQLYVRALSEETARALPGTEGSDGCVFSPDGEWIAFWAEGQLRKVRVSGGAPTVIATVDRFAGASWGSKDVIAYSTGVQGLWKVPASGGVPRRFTTVDTVAGETSHRTPFFLPDGETVLFSDWSGRGTRLAIASLDGRTTTLNAWGLSPRYVDGDRVLFTMLEGATMMASFDPQRRVLTSQPVPVLDEVDARTTGRVTLGLSRTGTLAFMHGRPQSVLVFVGPSGDQQSVAGEPRRMRHPRVSPDGSHIAVEIMSAGSSGASDVWSFDIASGNFTRLTFDGLSSDPIWAPDGVHVAFARSPNTANGTDVYWVAADGSTAPELLVGGAGSQWPGSFTPDGRTLIFDELTASATMMFVSAVSVGKDDRRSLIQTPFHNRLPAISPDGRWIAYTTDETGRPEVFVRPFPIVGGRWQVSTSGGTEPVWSRDGHSIFYRDGGRIIAADVRTTPGFTVTARRGLVDDRFVTDNGVNMDVTPNGKLLVLRPAESVTELSVVVNWLAELDRRLRGAR